MNARRWGAGVATGALLVAMGGATAWADDTPTIIPAPPGQADGVAVQIGPISIGHTTATADQPGGDKTEATANAIEINGTAPDSHVGGTAKKNQHASGAIVDTGDTPLGRLAIAPWDAAASDNGSATKADSSAALARLVLVNSGVLAVNVAQSESHATHNGMDSTGSASSDGATVGLGGQITLVVLHSEATSDNKGKSYVLGINDNQILTSDDAGGQCAGEVPGLLKFSCLNVSGGQGSPITAVVASVGVEPANQGAEVVAASGQSAKGSAVAARAEAPPAPAPAVDNSAAAQAPAAPAMLPRTGGPLDRLGAIGTALVMLGLAVVELSRRVRLAR